MRPIPLIDFRSLRSKTSKRPRSLGSLRTYVYTYELTAADERTRLLVALRTIIDQCLERRCVNDTTIDSSTALLSHEVVHCSL